ncbi:MAG: hydrogenase maturation protease [Eubacteriales bacterium]
MNRIIVLGVGNPIMKDDGIGLRVAQAIQPGMSGRNIEVVIGETDVSYCLDCICADDFLLVLDAMFMGETPGNVRAIPLGKAISGHARPYTVHDMNVVDALWAAFPDMRGYLIGIEPAVVGIGFDLSNCLKKRFDRICADVDSLIQKILVEKEAAGNP